MGRKGMTVAELVLAIGLLGVVIVFVLAVFTRLMTSSTQSSNQTLGLLFAQRRMDQAMRTGPPYWGVEAPVTMNTTLEDQDYYEETTSGQVGVYQTDTQAQTSYWYHFRAERTQRKPMGDLYRLTVDVVWWPSDETAAIKTTGEVRAGKGRQSLTLSRFYYHQFVKP